MISLAVTATRDRGLEWRAEARLLTRHYGRRVWVLPMQPVSVNQRKHEGHLSPTLTRVHELALCDAIVDTVTKRSDGQRVARVDVRIGHFRQVVPDSLVFCWELVTKGTDLDGCELVIDHVPAAIACQECGELTTLDLPILLCGACDSADVAIVSGEEFMIASIDRTQGAC